MKEMRQFFRPEFLKRVDEIVMFRRLSGPTKRSGGPTGGREAPPGDRKAACGHAQALAWLARGASPRLRRSALKGSSKRNWVDKLAMRLLEGKTTKGRPLR
jgi:hypothetical protein